MAPRGNSSESFSRSMTSVGYGETSGLFLDYEFQSQINSNKRSSKFLMA